MCCGVLKDDLVVRVAPDAYEDAMKFGPLGRLMDSLMMRARLDQGIAAIFQGLKGYVETGAGTGPRSEAR